jgi:hypothetical protein
MTARVHLQELGIFTAKINAFGVKQFFATYPK